MEQLQTENTLNGIKATNASSLTTSSGCVADQDNGLGYDTILRPTILGARLVGTPYSVANMQQASRNLYGTTSGITENKWYVRFKPADPRQLSILDSLNLDLFDYPLDYEVTQEGDYYNDGVTPAETIPWLYTVVPMNFVPPAGIQYELLQRMHVPASAALEREAFRITGNPVEPTGCGGIPVNGTGKKKDSDIADGVTCAAGYHYDIEVGRCVPNNCPQGYHWDNAQNMCVPDAPPPPPPADLQPSGTVWVFDNNRNTNVPVRNVRVIVKNFVHVERVFTNAQGQYFITREFNSARIYIRTKNDQATIRGLRRARLWQMLFPVEVYFGKFKGSLRGLQHVIGQNTNALSDGARDWAAASAHNNVQEYYEYAAQSNIGVPSGGLKILLTNWRVQGVRGAAPMYAKRYIQDLPETFVAYYIISKISNYVPIPSGFSSLIFVLKGQVDITLGYNLFRQRQADITATSDQMGETVFHELTHAAHHNKVGNGWWDDLVKAELNQMTTTNNAPYGNGTAGATSQIIALAESWGEHVGDFMSDRKYGLFSSNTDNMQFIYENNAPITDLSSHLNSLEDFSTDRTNDPDSWIPIGLYYDLTDDRNDNDAVPRRVALNDNVANFYTNQDFFDALDPDIRSMGAFQARLLAENGNNQAAGVNQIFAFYVR